MNFLPGPGISTGFNQFSLQWLDPPGPQVRGKMALSNYPTLETDHPFMFGTFFGEGPWDDFREMFELRRVHTFNLIEY